jgi:hypothetical protein
MIVMDTTHLVICNRRNEDQMIVMDKKGRIQLNLGLQL